MEDNALAEAPEVQAEQAEVEAAETPETEGESEAPAEEAQEAAGEIDEAPDPAKLESEIEHLRKIREKAEEDAAYWRRQKAEARADYFKSKDAPQPAAEQAGVGPEPKPESFESYDDYVKELTQYQVKKARAEWEREAEQRTRQQSQQERQASLQAKLNEGFRKYPDFEEVALNPSATHITPMVVDILAECEAPADVAYYLAKNAVEGVAISKMTPIQAARAIAKIESQFTGQSAQPPPKRTVSSAPPPIKPLSAGASGPTKDPSKMTNAEYKAWRESNGARRF